MIKFRFVFKKAPEQFFFPFGERKQTGIWVENLFQIDHDTGLKRRRKYSGHDGKSKIAVPKPAAAFGKRKEKYGEGGIRPLCSTPPLFQFSPAAGAQGPLVLPLAS